ncbi:MaoC family dehydratase [Krasilnikovia sp. M28-CT-15]|uniref:MaoC family dehydratase n=1 Tax=Krasilnikovia sp. M28-CT-15 TaxID=3373540 RepID=UPI0038760D3A
MAPIARFTGIDDLVGRDLLGTSDWVLVDQQLIDRFADVTGDRQWIHVDPERARRDGPFGSTIAHGALTLSLCVTFLEEIFSVDGVTYMINGGFDRVRFQTPVRAGSHVRGVVHLRHTRRMAAGARVVVRTTAEIQGERRPACVADHVLVLQM